MEMANTVPGEPESLWVQRTPGFCRLATNPEASVISNVLMTPAFTALAKEGAAMRECSPVKLMLLKINTARKNWDQAEGETGLNFKRVQYESTGDNRSRSPFLQATFPLSVKASPAIVLL